MWDVNGASNVESLGSAKHFWSFLSIDNWLPGSYGASWRSWPQNFPVTREDREHNSFLKAPFDQLSWVYNQIKTNPLNRQIVLQTYNPAYNKSVVSCPPCHPTLVFSSDGMHLDCFILARSWDMATGVPLDCFRYALLLTSMANDADLIPRFLKISSANTHIYSSHVEQIVEIISRVPIKNESRIIISKPLFEIDPEKDIKLQYQKALAINVMLDVRADDGIIIKKVVKGMNRNPRFGNIIGERGKFAL
jgi:thymidylate synthase